MHLFQAFYPTRQVQLEVFPQGGFRDIAQHRDLVVRKAVTLEPQYLHPALHQRHGMMQPFVIECFDNFRRKFMVYSHSVEDNSPAQFVNSKPRFLPALSIAQETRAFSSGCRPCAYMAKGEP